MAKVLTTKASVYFGDNSILIDGIDPSSFSVEVENEDKRNGLSRVTMSFLVDNNGEVIVNENGASLTSDGICDNLVIPERKFTSDIIISGEEFAKARMRMGDYDGID